MAGDGSGDGPASPKSSSPDPRYSPRASPLAPSSPDPQPLLTSDDDEPEMMSDAQAEVDSDAEAGADVEEGGARTSDESDDDVTAAPLADKSQDSVCSQLMPANAEVQDYSSFLDQIAADSPVPNTTAEEEAAASASTSATSLPPQPVVIAPKDDDVTHAPAAPAEEADAFREAFQPSALKHVTTQACAECGQAMNSDQHYWYCKRIPTL